MLTLHHLNNSRSQRVLWLLEELGIPYEVQQYQRDPKTMLAPPALKAIHPLGKSPIITDGAQTLAETGAIFQHLLAQHEGHSLVPPVGSAARQRLIYWLHYAEGSAMPPLLLKLLFTRMPKQAPWFLRPVARLIANGALSSFIDPQLRLHASYWEDQLSPAGWFVGDSFTAADIMMSFPVETAKVRGTVGAHTPRLLAYLDTIHARPAYVRALERGGPYAYAQ
ncbi:glutathione S-transferase [Lacibacterium aquatile]|uniref:Glutathione S-transferase n=1 Tax=Lacibacterium aquatile TaxID=1168082 RepID=A0ABW5DPJ5_9PROT